MSRLAAVRMARVIGAVGLVLLAVVVALIPVKGEPYRAYLESAWRAKRLAVPSPAALSRARVADGPACWTLADSVPWYVCGGPTMQWEVVSPSGSDRALEIVWFLDSRELVRRVVVARGFGHGLVPPMRADTLHVLGLPLGNARVALLNAFRIQGTPSVHIAKRMLLFDLGELARDGSAVPLDWSTLDRSPVWVSLLPLNAALDYTAYYEFDAGGTALVRAVGCPPS